MEPVTLTQFELGQLYIVIGYSNLAKLTPDLRAKLKGAFDQAERPPLLATDEDEGPNNVDSQ